jgi:transcription factor TFIIIB component B''
LENGIGKQGALNQVSSSKELTSQERASLTCPGSETPDDKAGSQGILETPSDDVLRVPLDLRVVLLLQIGFLKVTSKMLICLN